RLQWTARDPGVERGQELRPKPLFVKGRQSGVLLRVRGQPAGEQLHVDEALLSSARRREGRAGAQPGGPVGVRRLLAAPHGGLEPRPGGGKGGRREENAEKDVEM